MPSSTERARFKLTNQNGVGAHPARYGRLMSLMRSRLQVWPAPSASAQIRCRWARAGVWPAENTEPPKAQTVPVAMSSLTNSPHYPIPTWCLYGFGVHGALIEREESILHCGLQNSPANRASVGGGARVPLLGGVLEISLGYR